MTEAWGIAASQAQDNPVAWMVYAVGLVVVFLFADGEDF